MEAVLLLLTFGKLQISMSNVEIRKRTASVGVISAQLWKLSTDAKYRRKILLPLFRHGYSEFRECILKLTYGTYSVSKKLDFELILGINFLYKCGKLMLVVNFSASWTCFFLIQIAKLTGMVMSISYLHVFTTNIDTIAGICDYCGIIFVRGGECSLVAKIGEVILLLV